MYMYQVMLMGYNCFLFFFLIFFIKAYVVGTQVDAIQMSTHNICLYKEVDKN